jgi:hypothetical protein
MIKPCNVLTGFLLVLASCQSGTKENKGTGQTSSDKSPARMDIADIEAGIKAYIQEKFFIN